MVRLDAEGGSTFTPERLKEIQKRETICLPRWNPTPPDRTSGPEEGWGVALEPRGGAFIGIYKTKTKENNEIKEIFYAIAHTLLPESYIDEQQSREIQVQRLSDEFTFNDGARGKGISFEKEFILEEGGQHQIRAREVGREFARRILSDWSRIVDVKLDVMEVRPDDNGEGGEEEFRIPTDGLEPNPSLLLEALGIWPQGAFIRPYSHLPLDLPPDVIPTKLKGYQLGRALGHIKKRAPEDFQKLQEKFKIRFSDEIITFEPDCQTMINSFEVVGTNQIIWYNNSASSQQPFLVFNGLEVGFDCYNYNPITGKSIIGGFGDPQQAFPVIYPFKKGQREVTKETILKFCSPEGGGWLKPQVQPSQLNGTFTHPPTELEGLTIPVNKITLEPVHVFLAGGGDFYNTPVYNI
jgi:hypothetical protein